MAKPVSNTGRANNTNNGLAERSPHFKWDLLFLTNDTGGRCFESVPIQIIIIGGPLDFGRVK